MIETVPLEQAAEAYARMMEGKARFRIVLLTKDGISRQPRSGPDRIVGHSDTAGAWCTTGVVSGTEVSENTGHDMKNNTEAKQSAST